MKITLKRKLQLKSAVVYLKLKTDVYHEEIKEYLNSKIDFENKDEKINEIITRRIRKYLQYKEIFNSQNQLTPDGLKAKETGMVKEEEEGKYQIWYTQDDPLFENRIFFFRRVEPEKDNPRLEPLELNFSDKIFFSLPIKEKPRKPAQSPIEFIINKEIKVYRGESRKDVFIPSCTWIWNNINNSIFVFSGEFETNILKDGKPNIDKDIIDEGKPVDFKIDLNRHIPAIIPDWNSETRRNRLKIENIENDDIYKYFEYSGSLPREGYDSCVFEKLPVEPYNDEQAVIWRNKIIDMELEKKYIHPDDFEVTVNAINQKEGFAAFSEKLDVPGIGRYIEKLDEHGKKSDRAPAYWHLAAPLDLFVGIPQTLNIGHFSLLKEENTINFSKLAGKFGVNRADKIFYYDKYVHNYYQQRSVSAFLSCFGVKDICIITDTNNPDSKFDKYLAETKPEIIVTDISAIYQNKADAPHDRFIVFKSGGDLLVWTSTNSIDFIRFNNRGEIAPDTPGTILKSVTFTKIKPDVLGTRLKEFFLRG